MKMVRFGLTAALAVACLTLGVPTLHSAQKEKMAKAHAYFGEIMDSACASMGTHEPMAKKANITPPDVAKKCTEECIKMGSKYVLYNAKTSAVYELDDQVKPKEFSGEKVKVTGTLDAATKTIHVESITKAGAAHKAKKAAA